MPINSPFTRFAKKTSTYTGRPATFIIAVLIIVVWAFTGPLFDYSDTWQLVINTGTTIITFLMVFLIQNTQNRDTEALQIKLDEIIRAIGTANNALLDLEEMDDQELDRIRETYQGFGKGTTGTEWLMAPDGRRVSPFFAHPNVHTLCAIPRYVASVPIQRPCVSAVRSHRHSRPYVRCWFLAKSQTNGTVELQEASSGGTLATPEAAMDAFLARYNTSDSPGLAIRILRDGSPVYSKAFGMADLEHDIPITTSSVFQVASVSKQFTAFALLLLERDGSLSMDDDVRKHLPELPVYHHTITLRHLAQHTSGLAISTDLLPLRGMRSQ
ncbi:MAG: low affinity iron permease family protein [Flavobacteriales bacterium]|nr:low affinity iron permease family protein [Flavobacteriales bacterium]